MQWSRSGEENGNIQVKYKYFKTVLKYNTWVNALHLWQRARKELDTDK